MIKLFTPEQSAQGLAHDLGTVCCDCVGNHGAVEIIGFVNPVVKNLVEIAGERSVVAGGVIA